MSFLPQIGGSGLASPRPTVPLQNLTLAPAGVPAPGQGVTTSARSLALFAPQNLVRSEPQSTTQSGGRLVAPTNLSGPGPGAPGPGAPGPGAPGNVAPGTGTGGQVAPYSGGVAAGQGIGPGPGMGQLTNAGAAPGPYAPPQSFWPNSPGVAGPPAPGYDGGPSPSPTYPNVGAGLVRRAGPFGNQIGLGTLGDYLFHAAGGDRALNRNELMGALGVSSPIADTLLSTVGDGVTVPVQSLIEAFRPYSFDGINISDQGIDMALRETMGPVQANFFSFADPSGNLSMGGFAAIAREAMSFLGMPQPNPAMLSAAFRRLAGMDGVADISDASAMLPIGPDGSFSLGEMGGAIMNLLSTAPTPGGFGPPWGSRFGGPPPYSPGPLFPFGPAMPFSPPLASGMGGGFGMTRGQFGAMVNNASHWTGQYFHPAQIDAAYRNIGMMDGYPGVSPWEAGMAFGSSAPGPFQVTAGVAAHSWPSYPYWPTRSPWWP